MMEVRKPVLCAAFMLMASGCVGGGGTSGPATSASESDTTTTLPPDALGELGEKDREKLVEGTDARGRTWVMDIYWRPNNRQCVDVTIPAIDGTRKNGIC